MSLCIVTGVGADPGAGTSTGGFTGPGVSRDIVIGVGPAGADTGAGVSRGADTEAGVSLCIDIGAGVFRDIDIGVGADTFTFTPAMLCVVADVLIDADVAVGPP